MKKHSSPPSLISSEENTKPKRTHQKVTTEKMERNPDTTSLIRQKVLKRTVYPIKYDVLIVIVVKKLYEPTQYPLFCL